MLECTSGLLFSSAVTKECISKIAGKGSQLGATQIRKLNSSQGKLNQISLK